MKLLINLFGEKNEDSCCAIEIKEAKPGQEACCQGTEKPADKQTESEIKQSECC